MKKLVDILIYAIKSGVDDELVVFAKEPWTQNSEAMISSLDNNYTIPKSIVESGFSYFLEICVIKEVIEVLRSDRSPEKIFELLRYYAENDAYPEWVYES